MTVYCDHNATTPLRPDVLDAMLPWLRDEFANPSSVHGPGSRARCAVESARAEVAGLLGCHAAEVVFTSGGTESNDAAIRGSLRARSRCGPWRILTTPIEHASVLACVRDLDDAVVDSIAVDPSGRLDRTALDRALTDPADLVSVGWANSEIGTVQPIAALAEHCRSRGITLHADAVQAVGKVAVDVSAVDLASVSAHKIGGPKGVGALYVRSGTPWRPVLLGGSQERDRRAGTENVAGIVGFGRAAQLCVAQWRSEAARVQALRDELSQRLQAIAGMHRHGDRDRGLPNTLNVRFEGVRGEALVAALDIEGIAVSSGSACAAGAAEPSHVLLALGLDADAARNGVRFSFGAASVASDPSVIAAATAAAVARIRAVPAQRAVA